MSGRFIDSLTRFYLSPAASWLTLPQPVPSAKKIFIFVMLCKLDTIHQYPLQRVINGHVTTQKVNNSRRLFSVNLFDINFWHCNGRFLQGNKCFFAPNNWHLGFIGQCFRLYVCFPVKKKKKALE